jgi:hypothetical protein
MLFGGKLDVVDRRELLAALDLPPRGSAALHGLGAAEARPATRAVAAYVVPSSKSAHDASQSFACRAVDTARTVVNRQETLTIA